MGINLNTIKLSIVGIALGLAIGIGVYTFVYAKSYSYLSNNPMACANCHVMNEQDAELAQARDFQRKAQFYLDFVEAENSMGFHAPEEAARILGESINFTRLGQLSLRGETIPPANQTAMVISSHRNDFQ